MNNRRTASRVLVSAGLLVRSPAIAAPRTVSYVDAVPGFAPPGEPGIGRSGKDSRTREHPLSAPGSSLVTWFQVGVDRVPADLAAREGAGVPLLLTVSRSTDSPAS